MIIEMSKSSEEWVKKGMAKADPIKTNIYGCKDCRLLRPQPFFSVLNGSTLAKNF